MTYLAIALSVFLCLFAVTRVRRRRQALIAEASESAAGAGVEYTYMSEELRAFTRRSPEYTDNLSLLLAQPVTFRESLLRNLYGNFSAPARLRWEERNEEIAVFWEDATAVYRKNRPGSYADGSARREPLCQVSVARKECTATIRDHVPLYPEDLDKVIVRAESLNELKRKVDRWYADRYRELRPEYAQILEGLRTYEREGFESKVSEVFVCLVGSRLGCSSSLLLTSAAMWTGTLRTFLDVPRGLTADVLEVYLSLRGGWSGTKRELVDTARMLSGDSAGRVKRI